MENKPISMARRNSPRPDVEMLKKLNFVVAILNFWQPYWIDKRGSFVQLICNSTIYI